MSERFAALPQADQERISERISSQIASVREKTPSVPQKRTRQMRIYLLNYLTLQLGL
ncbi:hypothetical protein KA405_04880 [Patescibacteria group bacterium]|nr:hypothetical protein [Patescibacteria group bacterium]